MRFEQYKILKEHALAACTAAGADFTAAKQLHPILLAYIGDSVFSLYIRLRLLPTSSHVRIVSDIGAKMVSAVYQCKAMEALKETLTPEEAVVFRRGRNAKSMVPKSATVYEYRMATAFEALLGYLFLEEQEERLHELLDSSFAIITEKMRQPGKKEG